MTDHGTDKGRQLVQWYAGWAATASAIPLPFVDMAGVMALQVAMVRALARLHGVAMNPAEARTLLLSALGGAVSPSVTAMGVPSLLKSVPGIGSLLGSMAAPASAAAATLAVGEFFNRRLAAGTREAGGTALALILDYNVPAAAALPAPKEAVPPQGAMVAVAGTGAEPGATPPVPGDAEAEAKPASGRRRGGRRPRPPKAAGPARPPAGEEMP